MCSRRCRAVGRRVGPDKLGVLVRLGVDGLAAPPAGRESESDPGMAGAGVALVDRQDMAEHRGIEGDPVWVPTILS